MCALSLDSSSAQVLSANQPLKMADCGLLSLRLLEHGLDFGLKKCTEVALPGILLNLNYYFLLFSNHVVIHSYIVLLLYLLAHSFSNFVIDCAL